MEIHEGGKTDTKLGFMKGSGRGLARETKKAEEGAVEGGVARRE